MKTLFCFFLMLTITVATDVKLYVYNGYELHGTHRTKPAPRYIFTFGYHSDDVLSMQIYLSLKELNVSADLYVQYPSDIGNIRKKELPKIPDKVNQYFQIRRILNVSEIVVELELNTTTGIRTRTHLVKGIDVTGLPHEANDNDICLKEQYCVIEVDLLRNVNTESTAPRSPPANSVLIYVIPPVTIIITCLIILVTYLCVKKHCHQNSVPVETMELNTYATTNELVYAYLSLVHGDTQPPRRDEELPYYADIIGVVNSH